MSRSSRRRSNFKNAADVVVRRMSSQGPAAPYEARTRICTSPGTSVRASRLVSIAFCLANSEPKEAIEKYLRSVLLFIRQ